MDSCHHHYIKSCFWFNTRDLVFLIPTFGREPELQRSGVNEGSDVLPRIRRASPQDEKEEGVDQFRHRFRSLAAIDSATLKSTRERAMCINARD